VENYIPKCNTRRELTTTTTTKKKFKPFATGGVKLTVANLLVSSAGYLTHPVKKTESQDTQKYNYTFEGRK
jgi:hypothetical protein